MVVDDDSRIIEDLTDILSKEGFRVQSASNCLDALCVDAEQVPDVFLIDLGMSAVTGDRLCRVLGAQPQLTQSYRVLLSARDNAPAIDLEATGAHACVAKEPRDLMVQNLFKVFRQLDNQPADPTAMTQRDLEQENEALKDRLQHAQKMEAMGTLAGGIAHDFNNILQNILGYAQLSLTEVENPATVINNLEEIQSSAQNATSLIRRLLLFCRKVESQHRHIDFNKQIRHVAQMLERTIPRMIRIELDLEEDLQWINADGSLLEQILMNLGVNARDAMPGGGALLFATRNTNLDDAFCEEHPGAKPGNYVQLTVSDTGIGMTDEVRTHIFDPFFTTKHNGMGTGLGLAMVFGIVKDHDGFVACQSTPGRGTRFDLYFPAIADARHIETPKPAVGLESEGGTETILLVDDDKSIRDLGRQLLEKYGYTVITAESGEKALDIYVRNANGFDLVIIDLSMPGMGGLRCIQFLREIRPECRIIVSSGYTGKDQVKLGLEAGARDFIPKPYSIKELLPKIHQVMDQV